MGSRSMGSPEIPGKWRVNPGAEPVRALKHTRSVTLRQVRQGSRCRTLPGYPLCRDNPCGCPVPPIRPVGAASKAATRAVPAIPHGKWTWIGAWQQLINPVIGVHSCPLVVRRSTSWIPLSSLLQPLRGPSGPRQDCASRGGRQTAGGMAWRSVQELIPADIGHPVS